MAGQPVQLRSRRVPAGGWTAEAARAMSRRLDDRDAADIIGWAVARFGDRLRLATSFTDTVLVHLATTVDPDVHVVFLDTGFHFPETLDTMRRAQAAYGLNLEVVRPDPAAADVWQAGSEMCCRARKVDGLDRALASGGATAWLSGLRRADSSGRARTPVVDVDRRGLLKINPLAHWSDDRVAEYRARHDLVVNPLLAQGYPSVGCWPCTEPAPDDDPRRGRWVGSTKTECGLHR